ncbi:Ras-GAP domain-containing protein [Entamoeba marina]
MVCNHLTPASLKKKGSSSPKQSKSPRDHFMTSITKSPRGDTTKYNVSTSKSFNPELKGSSDSEKTIYLMKNEDKEFWKEVLLNFNSEVAAGVIAYFVRKDLRDEEKEINSLKICSYYSSQNKFPELLRYVFMREISCRYEEPDNTNTIYSSLLSSMFGYFGQFIVSEIPATLVKKFVKLKDCVLDEVENSNSRKTMAKFKDVLFDIVELMVNVKTLPNPIQFAYYTMYYLFTLKCPELLIKTMIKYVFKIPFNGFISALIKTSPEYFPVLMTISKLFNFLIDGTTSNSYWNHWLFTNCQDIKDLIISHIHKKSALCFDKKEMSLLFTDLPSPSFDQILNADWMNLKNYLTDESFEMIEIRKNPEYVLKQKAICLIREINNLRVNTFTETQSFLLKLTEMKMKIKDLNEERRYLKTLLGNDFVEEKEEEMDQSTE